MLRSSLVASLIWSIVTTVCVGLYVFVSLLEEGYIDWIIISIAYSAIPVEAIITAIIGSVIDDNK